MAEEAIRTKRRRPLRWAWIGLGVWLVACLAFAIEFATGYRGPIAWVGEWQFHTFDRYFPSVTITLAVLLAVVPLAAIAAIVARERRRHRERADRVLVEDAPLVRAIVSARRGNRFFGILSVLLAIGSLGALVVASRAPTAEGPVQRVEPDGSAATPQGHARYARSVQVGRIARIYENVAFARRTIWVAPVYAERRVDPAAYWTEVVPTDIPDQFRRIDSGVLVRGGLPPEVYPLYQSIGVTVAKDAALLMLDSDRPRWRMRALAIQAAVVSLLALGIALILRRQTKRLVTHRARLERAEAAPV